ncbi:MAG: caspase family protein [Rhizobiaceae bacterium]
MIRPFFILAVIFLIGWTQPALAKRVALVIGNSDYVHAPPLRNPGNDAEDMAAKLVQLDFEVVKGVDLDFIGMRRTIREFVNAIEDADIALFFYAGHGLQVGGRNLMAPIDAGLENENDLAFEAVPIDMVLSAMERSSKVNLVFLDACRNNPLARNLARSMGTRSSSVGRGLAQVGSGVGSMISFATQPGNVALDGKGRNSPFTAALIKNLGLPGEGITKSMIKVRNAVLKETNGEQVPWDNSSLTGEIILVPDLAAQKRNEEQRLKEKQERAEQAEIAYWNSIKDADDKAYFDAYLSKYPAGQFLDIAKLKLADLNKKVGPQPTQQSRASKDSTVPSEELSFDRSKLTMLNPESAGSALPKSTKLPSPEELEKGLNLKPEDYQRVQTSLNSLGYDVGAEDGAFGPKSRTGLRKYQIRRRIEESGYLTKGTLESLIKTLKDTPRTYDGIWMIELHRHNYSGNDPSGVNMRSLMGQAKVRLRDGQLFVVSSNVYTSDRTYFDTFRGRISGSGKLSVSMRIDTLFGKQQVRNVRATGTLPKLVPYFRTTTFRGTRLWTNPKKQENVWLRLNIRRLKS